MNKQQQTTKVFVDFNAAKKVNIASVYLMLYYHLNPDATTPPQFLGEGSNCVKALCLIHGGSDFQSFKMYLNTNFCVCHSCKAWIPDTFGFKKETMSTIDFTQVVLSNTLLSNRTITAQEAAAFILERVGNPLYAFDSSVGYQSAVATTHKFKKTITNKVTKGSPELLDYIYRMFLNCTASLTTRQEYEITHRKVFTTDWRKKKEFFNCPYGMDLFPVVNRFRRALASAGVAPMDVARVPGFYLNEKGEVCIIPVEGLGIILKNHKGQITGLDSRALDGEYAGKYKKYSSSFAEFGCSTGVVYDVVLTVLARALAFTEGHFKADAISEYFGFDAVSMGGSKLMDEHLEKELIEKHQEVNLFYDSDFRTNPGVRCGLEGAILKLQMLNHFKNIFVVMWDPEFGKGIDDVIKASHISQVYRITCEDYFAGNHSREFAVGKTN